MEEKQTMTNEQLEAELKSLRGRVTVAKIMTYGCGAAMVLCILTINIPLIVLFLVLALVGGYHLSKNTSTLKKLLGDNVISGVLNEVFDNVDYNPFGKIESIGSEGMVFPFSVEKMRGSDHIKATYKGLQVELSDIELYHVEDVYDSEHDRWEEREQKVFQGQWLICDFGKELSGEVRISDNAKKLRKQHKKDSVEMENEVFNKRFLVTTGNAQDAYYVLTPHMMEYILAMAGKSGGEVYMAFLRNGKLNVAVQTGRDFFELGKSEANIDKLRQKFLGELKWFTDIIDTLRVEETLYKKETKA